MKGAIYTLILLILVGSASATYEKVADIIFEYKGATCDSNGTIQINLSHIGRTLKFTEVNFTIENGIIGTQKLTGEWYQGTWKVTENYTGTDFDGSTRFTYQSNPKIYTSGKYIVTTYWPSNTQYYDRIKYAVNCPGITCTTNDDCNGQQACDDKTCVWLECPEGMYASGHACLSKCDDYNSCTTDYFIDDKCVYVEKDECKQTEESEEKLSLNIFQKFWNWLTSLF